MSSIYKGNVELSLFGESHSDAIGISINNLIPGIELDLDKIRFEMERRRPGKNALSTQRSEMDFFDIISGFFNGKTTGTPLTAIIQHKNTKSNDYESTKDLMRPSHADYTGIKRYDGFNDYRGGGHFSGRLTAPIVFAGAVFSQVLEKKGIVIGSKIDSLGGIYDENLDIAYPDMETVKGFRNHTFPLIDISKKKEMGLKILEAKDNLDSLGGTITTFALNIPPGVGSPFFDSFESTISRLVFSVPAVKGIEFGLGFDFKDKQGSTVNDELLYKDNKVMTYTNNNGGINGGITNGMPVVFKTVIKPTPSIYKEQKTIDIKSMENTTLEIHGRHDPCILLRAIPVMDAIMSIATYDMMLERGMLSE